MGVSRINSRYVEDMSKRMFEEIPEEIPLHVGFDLRSGRRVRRLFNRYQNNGYDEEMGYYGDARLSMIRGFGLHTFDDRLFFAKVTGRLDFIRERVKVFILRRLQALRKASIRLPNDVLRQIVGYTTILNIGGSHRKIL